MKILLLFGLLLTLSVPSFAVLMDFEEFSDLNKTEGTLNSFTSGGISVSLSAGSSQGGSDYDPYLDYNNAGVGVCKNSIESITSSDPVIGTNNKCKSPDGLNWRAGDDNLQHGEFLRLIFDHTVSISDIFIRAWFCGR